MARNGNATRHVDAPAEVVFARLTDVRGLPDWNRRITRVVEAPPKLEAGAQWVVEIRLPGATFHSRSVVLELDEESRRFVHRSKRDDDNPSDSVWTWQVDAEEQGSRVSVAWELRPATLLRRLVAAPIRALQIPRQDAPESLAALAAACEAEVSRRHR